jgi:hypothetical protein
MVCFMVCFLQVMKSGCFCYNDVRHLLFAWLFFIVRGSDGVSKLDL